MVRLSLTRLEARRLPIRLSIRTPKKLRYFAASTRLSPEIAEYPDTGRFGLHAELAPGIGDQPRMMMFVGCEKDTLDYWQGE
jgi:hypothetical protein